MSETTTEEKIVKEEVELDEKAFNVITEKTKEALMPEVQKAIEDGNAVLQTELEKSVEAAIAKLEETTRKTIPGDGDEDENDEIAKAIAEGKTKQSIADMTPAMRFMLGMKALVNEERGALKELNSYAIAAQRKARREIEKSGDQDKIAKTGYANETTQADGSVLIPDPEFVTTLYDNLPKYGVAFQYADVRQTDRTAVRVISLDSGLTFFSTAEAGVKTSAKLAFSKNEVSLQKYAVIVPATDELTDDAAIDYWNVVTRELTRAYAKKADEVVFTDTSSGITNLSGVLTKAVSGAGTTISWDDLFQSQAKTEDDLDESNFRWFMRKETWYRLIQLKASGSGEYLTGDLGVGWIPNPNTPQTPWGTPVVFTRVLPQSTTVSANDGFAIYGDLSNYLLYNKRGMALRMLQEATIVDADSVSTNLATQDISAMRAVIRLLGTCPKGNRGKFVILGTGTVS